MAERYLIASGNVNDPTKWDGGASTPAVGDDCYANGFTGTINVNFQVASVRNTAGSTAVAGGGFTLSAGVALTANVVGGAATCVTFSAANPNVGTAVGNITCASAALGAVRVSGSGRLNITGNVTGGTGASGLGVYQSSTGEVHVTGNVTGGSAASAMGLRNDGVGSIVTVSGIATAGSATSAHGVYHGGAGTVTIGTAQGNSFGPGGSGGVAYGVFADNTGASAITRIGAAIDGSRGAAAYGGAVTFTDLAAATHKVYKADATSTTLDAPGGGTVGPVIGCSFIRGMGQAA
jgi:hypothetical protein